MNILAPLSTIMTSELITVVSSDKLEKVKVIFDTNKIHHLPVVSGKEIVGIISKLDMLYFLKGMANKEEEDLLNEARLQHYKAEDIMTTGIAKLESTDRIAVALEVFKENLFHAIPIVDNNELQGIVTTYDIIKAVADQNTLV